MSAIAAAARTVIRRFEPGSIALLLASACWGAAVITAKIAVGGMGGMTLTLIELSVAVCLLTATMAVRGVRWPRWTGWLIAAGVLEPGLSYAALNLGVARTSASHASLLVGMSACFVVLLAAIFLRERMTRRSVAGTLVALIGVVVLYRRSEPGGDDDR